MSVVERLASKPKASVKLLLARQVRILWMIALVLSCCLAMRPASAQAPAAPTGLIATAGNGQATLTWTAVSGATSYTVYRSTSSGTELTGTVVTGVTTASYVATRLTNSATYFFEVAAVNASGTGPLSAEVSATPILPPPAGVTATGGSMQVSVGWTLVANAAGYNIYRGTAAGGESATPIATALTASPYADTGVSAGTQYFYKVAGTNRGVVSALSAEASAWTLCAAPAAPTGTPGDTTAALTWPAVPGATTYSVKRSKTSGSGYTAITTTASTSYADYHLVDGQTYYYVISAIDPAGEGPISAETAVTPVGGATPPSAPTGLAATGGNGQVSLTWNSVTGATSYNVYTTTTSGQELTGTIVTGLTATSYVATPLASGTKYYFAVAAVNANGTSALSSEASAWTLCAAPSAPGATAGNGQVALSWTAVTGAASYNVWRSATSGSGYTLVTNVAATSYTNTGLTNGTPYYFVVSAVDPAGDGPRSAQTASTPTAGTTGAPSAPTGLIATAGNGQATLTWTAVSGATTYSLYYTTTAGNELAGSVVNGIAAASYTVGRLTNGATYYFKVAAVNASGASPLSAEVSATPILPAPAGVTATGGSLQVSVGWTLVANASSYNIYRGTTAGGESSTAIVTGLTASPYVNTGLTAGTQYFYKVAATNRGAPSALSAEASAWTLCAAPGVPTAASGNAQATLSWTAVTGAATYNVKRATTSGGPYTTLTNTAATSFTNTGLTNGTTYYYVVSAVDPAGDGPNSPEASATPVAVVGPSAPTGLAATAGNGQVSLTWNAVTGATSYNVYTTTTSGQELTGTIVTGLTATSYAVTPLTNGTKYYFAVAAVNANGTSALSSEVSATPVLPAPTNLTATGGALAVSVAWTGVTNATGYSLYRGTTAGGESATPVATGLTSSPYSNSGLAAGTQYFYKLAATNGAVTSALSNEASAWTLCVLPSGVSATGANTSVVLTWAAVTGATSYNVRRSSTSGGPYTLVTNTSATSYTNTGLTNGTTYYFVVSAVDPAGDGPNSAQVSGVPTTAVSIPLGLNATPAANQVTLIWAAANNAITYNVYRGTTAGGESTTAVATGITATNYTDTGLTNGTTYYYYIKAVGTAGTSGKSAEVSATPQLVDVSLPNCVLFQAKDGLLYGASVRGGTNNNGTVFKIDPATGITTIIHSFAAMDASGLNVEGAEPYAGVIQATDGCFYGTTRYGGAHGGGTLYKIDASNNYTVLRQFGTDINEGSGSQAELLQASDGLIYGTLPYGTSTSAGNIFRVSTAGVYENVHTFTGPPDGASPYGGLVEGANHTLYGGTYGGGLSNPGDGTIYQVSESTKALTVTKQLNSANGPSNIQQALTIGLDGGLWGLAAGLAQSNAGTFFSAGTGFTPATRYSFSLTTTGNTPSGSLVQTPDSTFWSTTQYGGSANKGTIFKTTLTGAVTYLHTFTGYVSGNPAGSDGQYPQKGLTLAKDGNLYGAAYGGTKNFGCIFKLTTAGVYTVIRNFGEIPVAPTSVAATATSSTSAKVTWTGVYAANSYNVKRATSSSGPFVNVGSVTASPFTDTGLTTGTTYYYKVTALYGANEGALSTAASVTP